MLSDLPWLVNWSLILAALIILFAIGVPIGFAMGIVASVGLLLSGGGGLDYLLDALASITYAKATPYVFICFPLFIIMAELMTHGGISEKIFVLTDKLTGRLPGNLAVVTVIASTFFGAISSAAIIGAMVMGDMVLPETTKRNYDKSLILGTIAAGGTLSVLVPPSAMFIVWGVITGESIGELFMAGILPALIAATLFISFIVIRAIRNPELTPRVPIESSWKERLLAIARAWEVLLIIVIVMGGIYGGYATVTETAALAAIVAFIVTIAHRKLTLSSLYTILVRTSEMVGTIIILIVGAHLLIHFMTYLEIPQNLTDTIIDINLSKLELIIIILAMFFVLGCFIDPISVMMITIPPFLNILDTLEVNMIWLGVLVTISAMVANLTPPVGLSLFVLQTVGKPYGVTFTDVVRGCVPFILLMLITIALIIAVPSLATWLPSTMT